MFFTSAPMTNGKNKKPGGRVGALTIQNLRVWQYSDTYQTAVRQNMFHPLDEPKSDLFFFFACRPHGQAKDALSFAKQAAESESVPSKVWPVMEFWHVKMFCCLSWIFFAIWTDSEKFF